MRILFLLPDGCSFEVIANTGRYNNYQKSCYDNYFLLALRSTKGMQNAVLLLRMCVKISYLIQDFYVSLTCSLLVS